MLTGYSAFLVRCWYGGNEVVRVEIVQVQTGERTLVHSLGAALAWIDGQNPGSETTIRKGGANSAEEQQLEIMRSRQSQEGTIDR